MVESRIVVFLDKTKMETIKDNMDRKYSFSLPAPILFCSCFHSSIFSVSDTHRIKENEAVG